MNTKALIKKLQTALACRGKRVKIDRIQHFSEMDGRLMTKYIIREEREGAEKPKNRTVKETYRAHEVVMELAGMLRESGGDG